MSDRTVHGWDADGREIVRYDRAGKWYIEPKHFADERRRQVTVEEAATVAVRVTHPLPGGQAFRAKFDRREADRKEAQGE